jgi:glycosyltransferase involved in cell wall biosynthesis
MGNKLITIIIATYNSSRTIKRCLESIAMQKIDECEVVIVDGDSSDDTVEIIKLFPSLVDSLICEKDKSVYDAWNKGIMISRGEWVMFLGSDDILLPNSLNTYLRTIKIESIEKKVDLICARNQYVDEYGNLLKIIGEPPSWEKMRKFNVVAHVASLHNRTRLFKRTGLFNLDFKLCGDYELLLRCGANLKYYYIPCEIARMTIGGLSFSIRAIYEAFKIRAIHKTINPFHNILIFNMGLISFILINLKIRFNKFIRP